MFDILIIFYINIILESRGRVPKILATIDQHKPVGRVQPGLTDVHSTVEVNDIYSLQL